MIAYLTGSGFYEMAGFEKRKVTTRYGCSELYFGENTAGQSVLILPRHGSGHRYLPHQINHRANLRALADAGATAIISLSVCGLLDPSMPLTQPILAEDVYFPENRLGDASPCTFFTAPGESGHGHLLAGSLLNESLEQAVLTALVGAGQTLLKGNYAHVLGPRFNSRSEIRALRAAGADFLSQTCGPEAVLANELERPYALLGFGVDYANGVQTQPTAVEELKRNLACAQVVFESLIQHLALKSPPPRFENFIYRFE